MVSTTTSIVVNKRKELIELVATIIYVSIWLDNYLPHNFCKLLFLPRTQCYVINYCCKHFYRSDVNNHAYAHVQCNKTVEQEVTPLHTFLTIRNNLQAKHQLTVYDQTISSSFSRFNIQLFDCRLYCVRQ